MYLAAKPGPLPDSAVVVMAAPGLEAVDIGEDCGLDSLLAKPPLRWQTPRELFGLVAKQVATEEELTLVVLVSLKVY